jgi:predicted transcriptional regulator
MAAAGAPPKFREAHINWVFWKIAKNQPMGRKLLVHETGLGEGSLRTILERLEEYDLIDSAKAGRSLTPNGSKVFKKFSRMIRIEALGELEMSDKLSSCAILVKGAAEKVGSGMEQRDEAIRIGRSGATTLVLEEGRLMMPGFGSDVDMEKQYPGDARALKKLFNPEDGDAIIVGSENSSQAAEEAAWLAASTLLS